MEIIDGELSKEPASPLQKIWLLACLEDRNAKSIMK
jgi:hypothetical protein